MKRKLARCLLAVVLCLGMVCMMGASDVLVDPDYDNPSARLDSEVVVLNSDQDSAIGGFIVSITADRTYVVTDSIVALDSERPYVIFDHTLDGSGHVDASCARLSTVEWIDSNNTICLVSVPTTSDVTNEHTYAPVARVSYLSDGESVRRNYVHPDGNENLTANWRYVRQEETVARTNASYISSITDDCLTGMFVVEDWSDDNTAVVGAPVFNDDGVAIGVATVFYVDDELSLRFNAPLDHLIDYLLANNIDFQSYTSEFENNGGSSGGGSTGGGSSGSGSSDSGSTGGSSSSGSSSSGSSSGGSSSGSSSGGSTWHSGDSGRSSLVQDAITGGCIGLVSAVGVGIFVRLRKKKKQAKSAVAFQANMSDGFRNQTEPGNTVQVPGNTFASTPCSLVARSGPLEGLSFPLYAGDVVIGRRTDQCSIIYPDDTPGISRVHCRLSFAGGGYTLTDLGSSQGTYLNGVKLEPQQASQPLRQGDVIWLGSESNSMVFTTTAQT